MDLRPSEAAGRSVTLGEVNRYMSLASHNMYCYDPKVVNVNALRRDAMDLLKTERISIIHHHPSTEKCVGHEHELFAPKSTTGEGDQQ